MGADVVSVYKYLDLSTGHLTKADAHELSGGMVCGCRVIPHDYGAWVHVPSSRELADHERLTAHEHDECDLAVDVERAEELPSLHACIMRARALGALWINFDSDGDVDPELPTYEW